MAKIFTGNADPKLRDEAIVTLLTSLDDDYFVLLNTDWGGRESDIVVLRASDNSVVASALITTEVKHMSRSIRGDVNGVWEEEGVHGRWEPLKCGGRDMSPYWQTVNTANAMKEWMHNNQRLYRDDPEILGDDYFRVWPDLLLISPATVTHQLPLAPSNRFGKWFEDPERWLNHIRGWQPRKQGVSLSDREILRMVDLLRLEPFQCPSPKIVTESPQADTHALLTQLSGIEHHLHRLQQNIAELRKAMVAADHQ